MTNLLALDQGTSATKAVVCDESGTILADVDVTVMGTTYDDDRVEQDAEALLASLVEAGRDALSSSCASAVGIGNQGETVLAWDTRTGEPLGPALSWQDRRASTVTTAMDAAVAAELTHLSGLPLDPYFAAPKMAWLRSHLDPAPHVAITTIDAWVLHRLTGEFVTDAATASRTMLLDPNTLDWSDRALEAFGLEGLAMPRVIACDEPIGETSVFGSALPVVGAIVDQQAALLAEDCRERGAAKCTYGTGAFLLANVGSDHVASSSGLATSLAWALIDGTRASCVDGQVYTVGAGVSWLERIGLIDGPEDLDGVGGAVADSAGALCIPSLAGIGAPIWDPDARGVWRGLSLATTRAHLVRSFCEGIAAQVAVLADAVAADLGRPLTRLRVDGGLTRSTLVMQLQADMLGMPIEVYPRPCATALGIAALTARGHLGAGAEEGIVTGWSPAAIYEPGDDCAAAREQLHRFEAALRGS